MCEIVELNCCIFRCGIYKNSLQQIPPHLSKPECDALVGRIHGCGKPFKIIVTEIVKVEKKYEAVVCDYI
jgi:hypothetical protein